MKFATQISPLPNLSLKIENTYFTHTDWIDPKQIDKRKLCNNFYANSVYFKFKFVNAAWFIT